MIDPCQYTLYVMTATTAIFIMVAGCNLDYIVHICGSMCLRKKSPSFGLLSTSADKIFLLNAFQTSVSKATGKIKPTKSYSDYYVFLCSF